MCAIAGIVNLNTDPLTLQKMLATMARRGPDDKGVYKETACTLLHSRLAVIDPEGGRQPMTLQWGQEVYTIVYNGELYNTGEVRSELEKEGHEFRGHSDTEVVLHAFVQWGSQCLDMLNGIFAFAIWESRSKELFLARDRMGVKPLFFKLHEGGVLFASEIKTILAYPTVQAQLTSEGAAEVLLLGPGRTPGSGVFKDIYELEPGWYATCCKGKFSPIQYWKLRDREHTDDFSQTVEKVRYLVVDAIQRQLISDVPLGTFLSGGLDSSIISAIAASDMLCRGKVLDTFSVDYANNDIYFTPGKFQPDSDNHYIEIMRDSLRTAHHWTVLTPEDLVAELENATIARDLPGMADVDFSLLAFCRELRKHVTVALSGECADEIFGGYPWYRDPEVRDLDGFPWAQNTKYRASFLSRELAQKIDAEAFVRDRYRQTCAESDILPGTKPQEARIKQMVNLNQRWFMQTLLDRKDRMSMYSGLEVRVPFCDYRIAEYLYGVPWAFKDYQGREKGLLRKAVEGLLPHEILWRRKSPYPKTYDPRYLTLMSERMRELLSRKDAPLFAIVRREALESLLTTEYLWPWYGQLMKLPQTIAFMLQLNFWLEEYHISVQ